MQITMENIENNYCVIMAGGVGSRFWPYSTNDKPKQFLDFFGTGQSLIQMTVNRFKTLVPMENIYIVTNEHYKQIVKQQLPQLSDSQILLEPTRRNTAPCIAYATAKIKAITPKANIITAPSDHLILNEQQFINTIESGLKYVEEHNDLLTIGIKPTRPETGYGYIQIDNNENDGSIKTVKTFTEKPNLELAKVFYESGEFLWNAGIFLWNLQTIDSALNAYQPKIQEIFGQIAPMLNTQNEQSVIQQKFPECPNISIDYGVLEKANNVAVMSAEFGWSDLGTWGSLYELSGKDENQNVTLNCKAEYYGSERNIVALPKGKLAVIEGLEDYIVAEENDVLLICPKPEEQNIRQIVNDVQIKYEGKYN